MRDRKRCCRCPVSYFVTANAHVGFVWGRVQLQSLLEFDVCRDIETVYSFLKTRHAENLLLDERIATATREILPEGASVDIDHDGFVIMSTMLIVVVGKSRHQIQKEIKAKERAQNLIARQYSSKSIDEYDSLICSDRARAA